MEKYSYLNYLSPKCGKYFAQIVENVLLAHSCINKNRVWLDTKDKNSLKHNVYPDLNQYVNK